MERKINFLNSWCFYFLAGNFPSCSKIFIRFNDYPPPVMSGVPRLVSSQLPVVSGTCVRSPVRYIPKSAICKWEKPTLLQTGKASTGLVWKEGRGLPSQLPFPFSRSQYLPMLPGHLSNPPSSECRPLGYLSPWHLHRGQLHLHSCRALGDRYQKILNVCSGNARYWNEWINTQSCCLFVDKK